jgi:hypothetical protein
MFIPQQSSAANIHVIKYDVVCEFESRSGEVYSIQHYVIKFISDLRQVGGFLRVLRCPPPVKLTAAISPKYC